MRRKKDEPDIAQAKVPGTLAGRVKTGVELQQAMLEEQRETNRLLRELLARQS